MFLALSNEMFQVVFEDFEEFAMMPANHLPSVPSQLAPPQVFSVVARALPDLNRTHLRPYQLEALSSVCDAWKRRVTRQLVVLPTGSGKTTIFSQLPHLLPVLGLPEKLLVVAHRTELLEQAVNTLKFFNPKLKVSLEQASEQASPDADVIVAGIDTLMARECRRLHALPLERIGALVIDEAHRSAALSYRRLINIYAEAGQGLILGVTATPKRGDRVGLEHIFSEIVYFKHLEELIDAGHICPMTGFQVHTSADMEDIRIKQGDFAVDELARRVNTASRNGLVAETYAAKMPNAPALVFCADIRHSEAMADVFRRTGFSCESVHGKLDRRTRDERITAFRERKLDVLSSVQILTEGFDEPNIRGIFVARPTRSHLLYTQMVGRGFRPSPATGKQGLWVFDFVDNLGRHARHLMTFPTLFGLPLRCDFRGKSARIVSREIKRVAHLLAERRQEPEEMTIARAVEMVHREKAFESGSEATVTAEEMLRLLVVELEEVMRLEARKKELLHRWKQEPPPPRPAAVERQAVRQEPPLRILPTTTKETARPLPPPRWNDFAPRNLFGNWRQEPATERQILAFGSMGVALPISRVPGFTKFHAQRVFEWHKADAFQIPVRCAACNTQLLALCQEDPDYEEYLGAACDDPRYMCGPCAWKDCIQPVAEGFLNSKALSLQPTEKTLRAIETLVARTAGWLTREQLCDVLLGYRVVVYSGAERRTFSLAEFGSGIRLTSQLQRARTRREEESLLALVTEAVAALEKLKRVYITPDGRVSPVVEPDSWASIGESVLAVLEKVERGIGSG